MHTSLRSLAANIWASTSRLYCQCSVKQRFDGPVIGPRLSAKEKEVADEDSLKVGVIGREILPKMNAALRFGIREYYGDVEPIEICAGGLAPRGENDDTRFRADLATVRDSAYAGEQWWVPWAFLITQEEYLIARVSRPDIAPGIAASRPRREPQHVRVTSASTMMSSMSLDTKSYKFDGKDVEYKSIQVERVSWDDHGPKLTVKLLLWAAAMIVAGGILTVQPSYPPLACWVKRSNKYRHVTTGLELKRLPKDARVLQEPDAEGSSAKEDHDTYKHCRVRTGTNKVTGGKLIGIRLEHTKLAWTPKTDWRQRGRKFVNDKYRVYYEDGEENLGSEEEEEKEEEDKDEDEDEDADDDGEEEEVVSGRRRRDSKKDKGKGKGRRVR